MYANEADIIPHWCEQEKYISDITATIDLAEDKKNLIRKQTPFTQFKGMETVFSFK